MAKQTQTILIDDIDGSPAQQTIRFSFDGVNYEIDLSEHNANGFRDSMRHWIEHARRGGATRRRSAAAASANREELQRIREWARSRGMQVSDRGRIAASIRNQYYAENQH